MKYSHLTKKEIRVDTGNRGQSSFIFPTLEDLVFASFVIKSSSGFPPGLPDKVQIYNVI